MDDHHFVSITKGPKQNTGVEWECGGWRARGGPWWTWTQVILSWKSSRISFRSMWMAIGCGLWDKFLALWSSRNNSCWGAPDLVAPLFKLSSFPKLSLHLCHVNFALFPSSSYWRVLPFKEDSLLDLVFDTFKKIGWFSGCMFEFGSLSF